LATIVAGAVMLYVRLHRGPHGWALNFGESLNEFIVKFWYRFQRVGRPTVPRTGPVIVTSNHVSAADPLLLCAAASYRAISFMIAAEYANWPIVRFFVRAMQCIPVHRGTRETGATKQALRHLQEGRVVGIFIEGGIPNPGEIPQPKDGVAMMALRTGAVVVPAYISGMKMHQTLLRGLFSRQNARVRLGNPVDLDEFRDADPTRETIRAATAKIYDAVLALAPENEFRSRVGNRDIETTNVVTPAHE
jgi:1-acyl-sn-glycerol-3-phosphate acyltransferase